MQFQAIAQDKKSHGQKKMSHSLKIRTKDKSISFYFRSKLKTLSFTIAGKSNDWNVDSKKKEERKKKSENPIVLSLNEFECIRLTLSLSLCRAFFFLYFHPKSNVPLHETHSMRKKKVYEVYSPSCNLLMDQAKPVWCPFLSPT